MPSDATTDFNAGVAWCKGANLVVRACGTGRQHQRLDQFLFLFAQGLGVVIDQAIDCAWRHLVAE
ncbi:MAG: hypothetical protein CL484_02020 [Acidobacteria bacterium]|nr:hypothetical protein [Acidobacteriota bacterium]